jgi:hypothetical protein
MLILPMLFGAFQPPSPHRAGPPRSFPRAKNQELARILYPIQCVSQQILLSGLGGRKAPNSMGKTSIAGVLRLRATSAVSRDKSVKLRMTILWEF